MGGERWRGGLCTITHPPNNQTPTHPTRPDPTDNSSVEAVVAALPHDTHPMAVLLTGLAALSGAHPEQNPALAGEGIYKSRAVQDKQIVRLVGKVGLTLVLEVGLWGIGRAAGV
jgi:hypothetical protein